MLKNIIGAQQVNYTFISAFWFVWKSLLCRWIEGFLNVLLASVSIFTYSFFYKMFQKNISYSLLVKSYLKLPAFLKEVNLRKLWFFIDKHIFFLNKFIFKEFFYDQKQIFILFLFDIIAFKIVMKNGITFEFMCTSRKCYQVFFLRKMLAFFKRCVSCFIFLSSLK